MKRSDSLLVKLAVVIAVSGCSDGNGMPENSATTLGGGLHYAYATTLDLQCRCDPGGDYESCPEFTFSDHLTAIECADMLWGAHERELAELANCLGFLIVDHADCIRSRGCNALAECATEYRDAEIDECEGRWSDLGSFNDEVFQCAIP